MGKNDFLTPKAIANRIKAKGLQKLRWYCQMCQKQCRDENGFKCHCMSESHQRQMQVFGDNPDRFVDGYSEEFERTFMEHLKRSHRSRVAATVVYNEYIADRHHIHMNSTKWLTLTEFVKYLGRTGQCKVEETPKGWFITYIDREPETLLKETLKNKRAKADVVEELRHEKEIQQQIERAEKLASSKGDTGKVESVPEKSGEVSHNGKIAFALPKSALPKSTGETSDKRRREKVFEDGAEDDGADLKKKKTGEKGVESSLALAELMKEQERQKEKLNRKDYWLCEGIVVKVMSKVLQENGYYKQKGVVVKVIDRYVGEIKMLENGHLLRVDQQELETVIPQIGGLVRIVNGAYRGCTARLLGIYTEKYSAKVQIEKGIYDGRVLPSMEYEDICKIAQ